MGKKGLKHVRFQIYHHTMFVMGIADIAAALDNSAVVVVGVMV